MSNPTPNPTLETIKVLRHEGDSEVFRQPTRSYPGDAGFDLTVSESTFIRKGEVRSLPCGFDIELPSGWWGLIVPRSSTWANHGVLVQQAVIDQGYRGPMFIVAHNPGSHRGMLLGSDGEIYTDRSVAPKSVRVWKGVHIPAGARVAQIVPLPLFPGNVVEVDTLTPSPRGSNGFGSSGT